uniref:Uncharacterized protein n=1 Tax=Schistocephalus solidus TaxID=70667 RepID=A0A0X3PRY3_SCHSO
MRGSHAVLGRPSSIKAPSHTLATKSGQIVYSYVFVSTRSYRKGERNQSKNAFPGRMKGLASNIFSRSNHLASLSIWVSGLYSPRKYSEKLKRRSDGQRVIFQGQAG